MEVRNIADEKLLSLFAFRPDVLLTILLLLGCAGHRRPAETDWVEQKLNSMTCEQKLAQMFVPSYVPHFYNEDDPCFHHLLHLVRDYGVGGVMFFKGMPYEVLRALERLQEAADLPLLVMADIEWGLSMRVEETTRFPQNMAIAATGNVAYAYEIGRMTALEARAMGIHIGFAPVLDVNNNPNNVIINTRSFSEDPDVVAKFGTAFIRGMQENGVYATAKHYPGHGDTETDSHLSLATVSAARDRVREVELAPFKAAVEAGVKCVMVGHITFSQFSEMEGRPATLDSFFIRKVLRGEMGFDGLVVTDAMGMGGIREKYWSGEAAVLAINAGVDILLMSPNFEATFRFVLASVRAGRIPEATIDRSVRRILTAKLELGLSAHPVYRQDVLERELARQLYRQAAEGMAKDAITLVRDESGILPLMAEQLDSVLVVTVTDQEHGPHRGAFLEREVARRVPMTKTVIIDPRTTHAEMQKIVACSDSVDAIIVGIFVKWRDHKGTIALPDSMAGKVSRLFQTEKPTVVLSFGSPYILRQISESPSYLCAYETTPLVVRAGVRAIFGETAISGRLPVSIPELYQLGHGLSLPARKMELVRQPQDTLLASSYAVLEQAILDSIFPGAQVAIVQDGKLIASRSFGRQTYDSSSPQVTTKTIYDLASVTKVAATTMIAMKLWEQKQLVLDAPVRSYLPGFTGALKDAVTVRNLLTHSSGAHWWTDLWNKAANRAEALAHIYDLPLDYAPGDSMIYSDLGLIMLGKILETVTAKPLDQLATNIVYRPLGMKDTMFNPSQELLGRIAPTEIGGSMNRGLIHGDVHDENAFFLNGVSAHAGLFSTAEDLAILAQMLINGGIYAHHRIFSPETIRYWIARQHIPTWSTRALGWDTPSDEHSSVGDYFSPASFGHFGFTGTSFWVDPNRKIAVILLTNRVHPTRERGGMRQVRRDFHNAVMQALLKETSNEGSDVLER